MYDEAQAMYPSDGEKTDDPTAGFEGLSNAVNELDKELGYLFGRLDPVLRPSSPEAAMAEVSPPRSQLAGLTSRVRSIRLGVTEIHQRLDL